MVSTQQDKHTRKRGVIIVKLNGAHIGTWCVSQGVSTPNLTGNCAKRQQRVNRGVMTLNSKGSDTL